jgi:hypothetical protein
MKKLWSSHQPFSWLMDHAAPRGLHEFDACVPQPSATPRPNSPRLGRGTRILVGPEEPKHQPD